MQDSYRILTIFSQEKRILFKDLERYLAKPFWFLTTKAHILHMWLIFRSNFLVDSNQECVTWVCNHVLGKFSWRKTNRGLESDSIALARSRVLHSHNAFSPYECSINSWSNLKKDGKLKIIWKASWNPCSDCHTFHGNVWDNKMKLPQSYPAAGSFKKFADEKILKNYTVLKKINRGCPWGWRKLIP